MDEVTKAKMALHKELKRQVSIELAAENFAVMQREAKDILTLMFLVKRMQKTSLGNGIDSIDLSDLLLATERMRNSIIARWIVVGVANKDIASAFELTTARVSQIKKEIVKMKDPKDS